MKVTVTRSGGFAGLTRTWSDELDDDDPLFSELSWDEPTDAAPDGFVYRIALTREQASEREIVLSENRVEGPWRELVERVCEKKEG